MYLDISLLQTVPNNIFCYTVECFLTIFKYSINWFVLSRVYSTNCFIAKMWSCRLLPFLNPFGFVSCRSAAILKIFQGHFNIFWILCLVRLFSCNLHSHLYLFSYELGLLLLFSSPLALGLLFKLRWEILISFLYLVVPGVPGLSWHVFICSVISCVYHLFALYFCLWLLLHRLLLQLLCLWWFAIFASCFLFPVLLSLV